MREDYEESSRASRGLDFINTLYTFTEILEFAARLASRNVLHPGADITVTLHGTEGRRIISWDPRRRMFDFYIAADPEISFAKEVGADSLLGEAGDIALDATEYVFERFNSSDVPRTLLAEEQSKLLERRLS